MPYTAELINEAIAKLAGLPAVFSAYDVAAHADLANMEGAIASALRRQCEQQTILPLDERQNSTPSCNRYLGTLPAERWWTDSTIRWAKSGVNFLTPGQLAREMSLGFANWQWDTPPVSLLDCGRQWAMVADGYMPGTFVFPWAAVLCANPQGIKPFISIFAGELPFYEAALPSFYDAMDAAMASLTEREAGVLWKRYGLDTGRPETLEQVGGYYSVTRERIRQIEQKAWRKLWHQSRQRHLWSAFASDFVQSGGALLILASEMTTHRKFLNKGIGLKTVNVPELDLHLIMPDTAIAQYRCALRDVDAYLDAVVEQSYFLLLGVLQCLAQNDGEQVSNAEKKYRAKQVVKTRHRMIREALRSLGRAAHFQEIAELCNRMFPEHQATTHNWHAAAGRPDAEALGVVWIGRKGMFGLKEHGYERPSVDLYEGIARIVEDIFAKTQNPVSEEVVFNELSKDRRELHPNSVKMALSLNERLESVGLGKYVPKASTEAEPAKPQRPQYDISAAFAAFTDGGKIRGE